MSPVLSGKSQKQQFFVAKWLILQNLASSINFKSITNKNNHKIC